MVRVGFSGSILGDIVILLIFYSVPEDLSIRLVLIHLRVVSPGTLSLPSPASLERPHLLLKNLGINFILIFKSWKIGFANFLIFEHFS